MAIAVLKRSLVSFRTMLRKFGEQFMSVFNPITITIKVEIIPKAKIRVESIKLFQHLSVISNKTKKRYRNIARARLLLGRSR